ncbi:hypothetical protein B0H17DRAFT_1223749 [Mycena rosella]|uniref:Uncharacterized protein n=1 Tax=Mycena rosella TaxID=1033263 RepID=A0AAD7H290_MYCRO|nr:hypothetical protein B0H17DRAFT_1223749 [Mycena rosella]
MLVLILLISSFSPAITVLAKKPTVFTDLPCKFSLAAWNVTRHNTNSTGAPLVLGQDGESEKYVSLPNIYRPKTYASHPYNVYPTVSLSNGSLRAYRASGAWLTNAATPRPLQAAASSHGTPARFSTATHRASTALCSTRTPQGVCAFWLRTVSTISGPYARLAVTWHRLA